METETKVSGAGAILAHLMSGARMRKNAQSNGRRCEQPHLCAASVVDDTQRLSCTGLKREGETHKNSFTLVRSVQHRQSTVQRKTSIKVGRLPSEESKEHG